MVEYEKINTIWKRDQKGKIIEGEYSKEEYDIIDRWEVSEKIDGQCIIIFINKADIIIYGKTDKTEFNEAHKPLLAYINSKITREVIDSIFDFDKAFIITLYGEGYGPKIQSGGQYGAEQKFILFDIKIDDVWLEGEKVTDFANKLGVERVPIFNLIWAKNEIINFVKSSPKSLLADCSMEGVVCRSKPLLLDRMGRRVIFKLKRKDFR